MTTVGRNRNKSLRKNIKKKAPAFIPPPFTLSELHRAIPPHCFNRSLFLSFSYLVVDITLVGVVFLVALTIRQHIPQDSILCKTIFWSIYAIAQSIFGTGIWIIAHECGHMAFSKYSFLNHTLGFILHSMLLVPYFSWQISHAKHHQHTNHMEKDQAYIPYTKSEAENALRYVRQIDAVIREKYANEIQDDEDELEPEGDLEDTLKVSPLFTFGKLVFFLLFGWQLYLWTHTSGEAFGKWTSHFHPTSPLFDKNQRPWVVLSDLGILAMLGCLYYAGTCWGFDSVCLFYGIPYILIHSWIVLITYLHHTDVNIPHYKDPEWKFVRGALCTVDRDYGRFLNVAFHHLSDTHVVHHLFSTMPHYHTLEATQHIKHILGDHYHFSNKNLLASFWESLSKCIYVEDNQDIAFHKY